MCISQCSKITDCKLISFNKLSKICTYYNDYLENNTELIDMNKNFVYLIEKPNYVLKGIKYTNIVIDSNVRSLVQLQNGDLACGPQNGRIKIWSTINWSLICSINAHIGNVRSLALLQNGYIASGSSDDTIKIWSPILNSLTLINTLYGHNDIQ